MKILMKGGHLVDPACKINRKMDMLIDEGVVVEVSPEIRTGCKGVEALDLAGKVIVPGFIDMHVHLRDPGEKAKSRETIGSGLAAAVAGGFTAVACMPNTVPAADNKAVIEYIKQEAGRVNLAKLYPVGAVTKGRLGQELTDIGEMYEHGVRGFSDDGAAVWRSDLMRAALEYMRMFDIPLIDHCEDPALVITPGINEGDVSRLLGLTGSPSVAETVMVARDILLAEHTGGWVHIAHVSAAGSVVLIREAKKRGVRVTAEVTPHHLLLTEEAVKGYNTDAKMNPPLRTEKDRQALLAGVSEGTIDVIVTDHAPHRLEDKQQDFILAPSGVVGLETAVPLLLTELVAKGLLSMEQLVERLSVAPARFLGTDGGTLAPGQPADITVLDMCLEAVIERESFYSKGRNTPFQGWPVRGMPVLTIVDGEIKMREGCVMT